MASDACGRLGQRDEIEEAFRRGSVAVEPQIPRVQRLDEPTVVPKQRGQRARVGIEGRVGLPGLAAGALEPAVGDVW
jgi:hypothetical protein